MKAEIIDTKEFKPVTLALRFETEIEFKLFRQFIGNTSREDFIKKANKSAEYNAINTFTNYDSDMIEYIYKTLIGVS